MLGFKIKNKITISKKEKIIFRSFDEMSLVIQYLKKLTGLIRRFDNSPFEIIPATSTDLDDITIALTNISKKA